ncbi:MULTISPECIES: alpha/beta hydrolase-fold protein [unclassified Pseudomonas]|uniref:alpha/beta hydrolase n=1 Tax=unclassified Pseudomonas TaxID=196821 RepID=UPI00244CE5CD|nr:MULTISPECIES: alpha/beta hydrolase-fold protein [unclassified Pseudomonas]MDG9924985.1 alpha/beta hydrolase-fold protein [Pseudomonas sp. GD04045]MDH0036266.1 alpha/beta hydrolase-fold protein [Pseudomonas sp. GD04019]
MLQRILPRLLGVLLIILAPLAQARPEPDQRLGETLVERGSAHYRFEHFELASADGQRHYRVRLGIPRQAAPAAGYPALYLLDGNAALAALREDWLAELSQGQPPLLVLVGPASDSRLDLDGRMLDYTPAPSGGPGTPDAMLGNRPTGGAAAFRALLVQRIRPEVLRRVAVDQDRQGLWGHSLGGLFVLDSLFVAPSDFRFYIAASPSLWWQSGLLLERHRDFAGSDAQTRLLILRGSAERPSRGQLAADSPRALAMAALPADTPQRLAERLDALPGLHAEFHEFAGLDHGPALAASLRPALRLLAGLAPLEAVR